jgi:uncharacterized protein (DUF433 family)
VLARDIMTTGRQLAEDRVMTLPDFLHQGPMGEIRFVGTRIDLYFVIEGYNQGWPAEAIAVRYDSVRLADIQKAIDFYDTNRAEVDAYIRETDRLGEELQAQSKRIDLDQLRAKLAARQAEQAGKIAG